MNMNAMISLLLLLHRMNEKIPLKKGSAEEKYIIDRESGYFKALQFSRNPVEYVRMYLQGLIDDEFADEDVYQQAMAEVAELGEIIDNEHIAVTDTQVLALQQAEPGSEAWAKTLFLIFKQAGFTKEQALAWVILDDPEMTAEELLKERRLRYFIMQLYDAL
jgi:hypothetical protein